MLNYWPALLIGFAGSLHCVLMCGPLAMAVPAGAQLSARWYINRTVYQAGRLSTYAILGVLAAMLGKSLVIIGWQQGLSVLAGALLLLWAISTSRAERFLLNNRLTHQVLKHFRSLLKISLKKGGYTAQFSLGLFNGILPCSMVYIALSGALVVNSPAVGALWMLAFGLGTVPALGLSMVLGESLKSRASLLWKVATPVLSAALGLLLLIRGLNLGIPYLSPIMLWVEKTIPICGA
jgi:sulfite exporter TauE/SafE